MSKIFETEQDLIREEEVVKRFAALGGYSYTKLPRNGLDFLVHHNGDGKCFVEVKTYNMPFDRHPDQILSLLKWEKMNEFEYLMPTFLVCRYSDNEILYVRAKDIRGNIKMAGRQPREGSSNDQEWCVHIPKSLFKKMKS